MRDETELKWCFNLISSKKISNTLLVKKGGTYDEFEKIAEAGIRNERFRDWFCKLQKLGIIEFFEKIENTKGKDSALYTLNNIKLLNYLYEKNPLYKKAYKSVIIDFKAIKR